MTQAPVNPLASNKPIETVMEKGCICPFTFADGTPGYSCYDTKGKRTSKHKFEGDETLDTVAQKKGVTISEIPPGANQRKGQRPGR